MIDQFHLLRPAWLLALIPLVLLLVWLHRTKRVKGAWQAFCDPQLIPYILEGSAQVKRIRNSILIGVAGVLAILALAGPAWQQLPQPVFEQRSALVVMLDLSRSMDASDVTPSRLTRARLKLLDLLRLRKEGQTALIVYAGDAFVVTPLTDDTDTIAALVQSLSTTIMPSQGSRPNRAIQKALELLAQVSMQTGSLLLITDGINPSEVEDLADLVVNAGHRLSVIGVGTGDGAPIPDGQGGFIKDTTGQIVIPKVDQVSLEQLARQTGGVYTSMQIDDSDITQVLSLSSVNPLQVGSEKAELQTDQWREEGPWLLLLLLPLATLAFRRGLLVVVVSLVVYWPDGAIAVGWDDIWLNSNQKGIQAMERENYLDAAQQFTDDQWKAAAYYRAGDYEKAIASLERIDTPDASYNRGNALARLGRIQDAIKSYRQTLQQQPGHEDAKHNLELLEKLLDQQNQQNQKNQQSQQDPQKPSQSNQQQSDGKGAQQEQQQSAQDNQSGDNREQSTNKSQDQSRSSQQQSKQELSSDPAPPQPSQQNAQPNDQSQQHPQQKDTNSKESELTESKKQHEQKQATEQWLRRIPDDPGGLLRRKFRYQYSQRNQHPEQETQRW